MSMVSHVTFHMRVYFCTVSNASVISYRQIYLTKTRVNWTNLARFKIWLLILLLRSIYRSKTVVGVCKGWWGSLSVTFGKWFNKKILLKLQLNENNEVGEWRYINYDCSLAIFNKRRKYLITWPIFEVD